MKNIALIINSLQGGGAERCAADLSIYFSQKGYCVYLITEVSMGIKYEYGGTLVNYIFSLKSAGGAQESDTLKRKVDELREIKEKYHVDIAISFMQTANYLNILSKENEKIILTTHSLNSEYAKLDKSLPWSEQTFKELYQYADMITFPSDWCRNDWIKHYGDENGITRTVYNPVHYMNVSQNTYKENIVISIGRMHGVKRQWHLIRAFKLVKEECPNSKLVILGEGGLRAALTSLIERLGLQDDIEMPGNVRNVQDYLALAKVYVTTSRCEAMPCSVLEAMSAGVPVVACDIPGGIREELGIEGSLEKKTYPIMADCGIITPYIKDEQSDGFSYEEKCLAKEIVKLLENEQLRQAMGHRAVKRAEEFIIEKVGATWIYDIFHTCLNREIDQEKFDKVREKNFMEFHSQNAANERLNEAYYKLLEKWMVLRERGKNIRKFFKDRKYHNIIIYGLGKMANHLIYDLNVSDINIVCAIDKAAINKYGNFPIVTNDAEIPSADCIIITPVYEFEEIRNELRIKTDVPIISLNEVIDFVNDL
ncbi:MAG: glycosyltransferase [Lachnospiraceae bacterium]|nr:glycosyltransferase [Lachnospiraceae bacterium]